MSITKRHLVFSNSWGSSAFFQRCLSFFYLSYAHFHYYQTILHNFFIRRTPIDSSLFISGNQQLLLINKPSYKNSDPFLKLS
jgi:hypothetical protein